MPAALAHCRARGKGLLVQLLHPSAAGKSHRPTFHQAMLCSGPSPPGRAAEQLFRYWGLAFTRSCSEAAKPCSPSSCAADGAAGRITAPPGIDTAAPGFTAQQRDSSAMGRAWVSPGFLSATCRRAVPAARGPPVPTGTGNQAVGLPTVSPSPRAHGFARSTDHFTALGSYSLLRVTRRSPR